MVIVAGTAIAALLWAGIRQPELSRHAITDFAAARPPPSDYVELTAVPQFEATFEYGDNTVFASGLRYVIIPITGPDWEPGEPVAVVLKTFASWQRDLHQYYDPPADRHERLMLDDPLAPAGMRHMHDEQGRAMLRIRGLVQRDGLSAPSEEAVLEAGLALSDPYYVIDQTWTPGGRGSLLLALIFGVPVGLATLTVIIFGLGRLLEVVKPDRPSRRAT